MSEKIKNKRVLLRAFKIKNSMLSSSDSKIKERLIKKLEFYKKSQDRCMDLNENDLSDEKDLISNYENYSVEQSLFCTLLRMSIGSEVQHITKNLLNRIKFNIENLESENLETAAIYKDHFYFSIKGDYLVTGMLAGNRTIKPLQTYLSWFLKDENFELTPVIKPPSEYKLSDLKSANFSDITIKHDSKEKTSSSLNETGKQVTNINKFVLDKITSLFKDNISLNDVDLSQVISAELIIKFKKPKEMTNEEYEDKFGALLKPVSDVESIKFQTKDKKTEVSGKDLLHTKIIYVEETQNGFINEQELMQEMGKYLKELKDEDNM